MALGKNKTTPKNQIPACSAMGETETTTPRSRPEKSTVPQPNAAASVREQKEMEKEKERQAHALTLAKGSKQQIGYLHAVHFTKCKLASKETSYYFVVQFECARLYALNESGECDGSAGQMNGLAAKFTPEAVGTVGFSNIFKPCNLGSANSAGYESKTTFARNMWVYAFYNQQHPKVKACIKYAGPSAMEADKTFQFLVEERAVDLTAYAKKNRIFFQTRNLGTVQQKLCQVIRYFEIVDCPSDVTEESTNLPGTIDTIFWPDNVDARIQVSQYFTYENSEMEDNDNISGHDIDQTLSILSTAKEMVNKLRMTDPVFRIELGLPSSDGLTSTSTSSGLSFTSTGSGLPSTSTMSSGVSFTSTGSGLPSTSTSSGLSCTSTGSGLPSTSTGSGLPSSSTGSGFISTSSSSASTFTSLTFGLTSTSSSGASVDTRTTPVVTMPPTHPSSTSPTGILNVSGSELNLDEQSIDNVNKALNVSDIKQAALVIEEIRMEKDLEIPIRTVSFQQMNAPEQKRLREYYKKTANEYLDKWRGAGGGIKRAKKGQGKRALKKVAEHVVNFTFLPANIPGGPQNPRYMPLTGKRRYFISRDSYETVKRNAANIEDLYEGLMWECLLNVENRHIISDYKMTVKRCGFAKICGELFHDLWDFIKVEIASLAAADGVFPKEKSKWHDSNIPDLKDFWISQRRTFHTRIDTIQKHIAASD